MSKIDKKIKIFNYADLAVSILVVAFVFIFAFSAMMTTHLGGDISEILPEIFPEAPSVPESTHTETENNRGSSEYPTLYAAEVKAAAEKYGIEEERIYAVIKVESNFKKDAVSVADARGLMQMLPSTYKSQCNRLGLEYREEDLFDPAVNIDICTYYLKRMYDMYEDWNHAHAAYNAGYGNVNKWLKTPEYVRENKLIIEKIPFTETKNYVNRVNYYYLKYKLANASK